MTVHLSRRGAVPFALSLAQLAVGTVAAQTTEPVLLDEITVSTTRVEKRQEQVPYAITSVSGDDVQFARQQLGLDESLAKVPGVFFQDRLNFAQDLRISIRGFGARSNFGIRGIKVLADGIPATLPDGQGGVDDIDLGSAERIEVIRGPSSALYGSASGGVINVMSERGTEEPFVQGRFAAGSHAFLDTQLKAGGQVEAFDYLVNLSRLSMDGFRDHSRTVRWLGNTKLGYRVDENAELTVVANAVESPRADDPGALTLAEVRADRTQARALNVAFDAGESLTQQKLGVVYKRDLGNERELRVRGYGLQRDFENRLPFAGAVADSSGGQVQFQRLFFGGGVEFVHGGDLLGHGNRLVAGVDVDVQDDDRLRHVNAFGSRGVLTMDQNETVRGVGVFVQDEFTVVPDVELTAGLRYDNVRFEVDDHFLANTSGDDSGELDFEEWSPTVGLRWSPHEAVNLYASVSTAFETPTTTELANPNGGGFNPALGSQTAVNYEVGAKGVVDGQLRYDLALFRIDVEDELVPFELPAQPGRSFFENAASSTRHGVELGLTLQPKALPGLTASLAYTYSRFEFDTFRPRGGGVFDGRDIPGIPRHRLHAELAWYHGDGFFGVLDHTVTGTFYADNANATKVDAYQVTNLRFGWTMPIDDAEVTAFFGINNLFDQRYDDNIRVNAFGGRFYEPAPGRNVFGGLSVRFGG